MVSRCSLDYKILWVNDVFCEYVGSDPRDFRGKSFIPFIHPQNLPSVFAAYRAVLETRKPQEVFIHAVNPRTGKINFGQRIILPLFARGNIVEFESFGWILG